MVLKQFWMELMKKKNKKKQSLYNWMLQFTISKILLSRTFLKLIWNTNMYMYLQCKSIVDDPIHYVQVYRDMYKGIRRYSWYWR